MTDLSRRGFFALAATVVTAACGSSGTAKPADSSADPGSSAAQTTAAASVEPTEAPTTEAPTTAAPTTVPPPSTVALDADPFVLGVTSGDPAADGFVLWTRLVGPADDVTVRYELSMDEGFAELAAFGDTIMPARSEKIAGNALSAFFNFSVTCSGPVISTDSMLVRSALTFER